MITSELPHGYTLHFHEHKGLRGQHLIAITRPDGEPIRICNAPPLWASRFHVGRSLVDAVDGDLETIAEEEK